MKNSNGHHKKDGFIALARRAFRRVARQIRAEHARPGLPPVFGDTGKIRLIRAQ